MDKKVSTSSTLDEMLTTLDASFVSNIEEIDWERRYDSIFSFLDSKNLNITAPGDHFRPSGFTLSALKAPKIKSAHLSTYSPKTKTNNESPVMRPKIITKFSL